MIEHESYGKLESLAELEDAIQMGLDIEFLLHDARYNISWRDNKPFICECRRKRLSSLTRRTFITRVRS